MSHERTQRVFETYFHNYHSADNHCKRHGWQGQNRGMCPSCTRYAINAAAGFYNEEEGKHQVGAAKPVWVNLLLIDSQNRTHYNGSELVHGRPQKGDLFEIVGVDSTIDPDVTLFGEVTLVRYGTTTDGSFKPTIVVTIKQ